MQRLIAVALVLALALFGVPAAAQDDNKPVGPPPVQQPEPDDQPGEPQPAPQPDDNKPDESDEGAGPAVPPAPTAVDVGSRVITPAQGQAAANGGGAFFVQFADALSADARTELATAGVTFAQAVPPSTYIVRLEPGAAAAVVRHPLFVGLEPMARADKQTNAIRNRQIPAHARAAGGDIEGTVEFFPDVNLTDALAAADAAGVTVADRTRLLAGDRLQISGSEAALDALAADGTVLVMGEAPPPPAVDNTVAQALHDVDDVQAAGGTGAGVILGIWDGGPVYEVHGDLGATRIDINEGTGSNYHATHVAGTIMGTGVGNAAAEGMAPGVPKLESYDFNGDVADEMTIAAASENIVASNHSWGFNAGWNPGNSTWYGETTFGQYTTTARDWDVAVEATDTIIVKSSGNDRGHCGGAVDPTGNCDGFLAGDGLYYDNISQQGTSKNIITVGALNDDGTTITSFSSVGPADDGRFKPDVVANGAGLFSAWDLIGTPNVPGCNGLLYCSISGTSMSTPVITGIVALMEEQHRNQHSGADLPPALAKAALINTTTDLGRAGPDYVYGYGSVNADAALAALDPAYSVSSRVGDDQTVTRQFTLPAFVPQRLTVSWIDPAGTATSTDNDTAAKLINNLDLRVIDPNGATYYPYSGPGRANPTALATTTGPNTVDNTEQIFFVAPVAGTYTIIVNGTSVPAGPQDFSIASLWPLQNSCPADDGFEENDTQPTATALSNGDLVSARACDDDWFSIPAAAGTLIDATAFFSDAAGDLDLSLFDPSGSFVTSSRSTSDNESISHTATTTGEYGVRMNGYLGAVNAYDLSVTAPICPPDDGFEPNNSQAAATAIINGETAAGVTCDSDWFEIPVLAGSTIDVEAVFSDNSGDIDMQLHNPAGTVVESGTSVNDNEVISYVAPTSGVYAVNVYGYNGAENVYELTVDLTPNSCPPDDGFEPNDFQGAATPLSDGDVINAVACTGNQDWYSIPAATGGLIGFEATFVDAVGDIDLYLFDPNGSLVDSSAGFGDGESLLYVAATTGDHYALVEAATSNTYTLEANAEICTPDDDNWPNFNSSLATPLRLVTPLAGVACVFEPDWFAVPAVAGSVIDVSVEFTHARGNIDVDLYDPAVTSILQSSTSVTDDESIFYTALETGVHYIKVETFGLENSYTIESTSFPCVAPDDYEPNNTIGTATPLTNGTPVSGEACDSDWFTIPVVAGEQIDLTLDVWDYVFSPLGVQLSDPTGTFVAGSVATGGAVESINHVATQTGLYQVEVFPLGVSWYDLQVDITPIIVPGSIGKTEGNTGSKILKVPVTLSSPSAVPVTVDWTTQPNGDPGFATAGVDYQAASGQVTFLPGEIAKSVDITIFGDTLDEADLVFGEWILVVFSSPTNALLDTSFFGLGIGVIIDDDPPPVISLDFTGAVESAGVINMPVNLSAASGNTITVDFASLNVPDPGFATPVDDFVPTSGTVTFLPGSTQQFVPVTIIDDTLDEPPLYFGEWGLVSFTNATNATIDTSFFQVGVFIIVDDD